MGAAVMRRRDLHVFHVARSLRYLIPIGFGGISSGRSSIRISCREPTGTRFRRQTFCPRMLKMAGRAVSEIALGDGAVSGAWVGKARREQSRHAGGIDDSLCGHPFVRLAPTRPRFIVTRNLV